MLFTATKPTLYIYTKYKIIHIMLAVDTEYSMWGICREQRKNTADINGI